MSEITFAQRLGRHVAGEHETSSQLAEWMRLLLLDHLAVAAGGAQRDSAVAVRAAFVTSAKRSEARPASIRSGLRSISSQTFNGYSIQHAGTQSLFHKNGDPRLIDDDGSSELDGRVRRCCAIW